MIRIMWGGLLSILLLLMGSRGVCGGFDERMWQYYAEIENRVNLEPNHLAGFYLEPDVFSNVASERAFADLRVVTAARQEVPWTIIVCRPEKIHERLPVRMGNLSQTENGETWLELRVEKPESAVSAIEIITPDSDFSRQVQVLGSRDGNHWNSLRNDGVIFDSSLEENLRHTKITFPESTFPYLGLKVNNGGAQPLNITGVQALQNRSSPGQTYTIGGKVEGQTVLTSTHESAVTIRMDQVFPLDRLVIKTLDRNFQRTVEIRIKGKGGNWIYWAQGSVFNIETEKIRESDLTIEMPEITTEQFRLVFRNLDSPALKIDGVTGQGYHRLLVFKEQGHRKRYLFWGNPAARKPQYDLAGLLVKQQADDIPRAYLGPVQTNPKYGGDKARKPFTERYKHLLYAVVVLVIVGLLFLQYRVFRRMD